MADVVMYTKKDCPYCKEGKEFFDEKGVKYSEFMLGEDANLRAEMERKSGGRSDTPQVFINGKHIGSFDDIKALEATGHLEEMLDL